MIERDAVALVNLPTAACGKRVAIVSLHFSPAHASFMVAYGKLLSELGFVVSYVVHERYLAIVDLAASGEVIQCSGSRDVGRYGFTLALFFNSATGNHSLAHTLRLQGVSVFYLFHEPLSIWNLRGEGWKQIIRFPFSTFCSIAMLHASNGVIVPSACAHTQYERYFLKHNRNVHTMPLLFDDEIGAARMNAMRHEKRFFGFVGSTSRSHNFNAFLAFVKFAIRNGSSIPFAIATRDDISALLSADSELATYVNRGSIQVQHGRVLANEEINQCYLECFCVWNVYRRSTQSGVLPKAFMAGTPVLASRIGSFPEFVSQGVTGEFVDSIGDLPGILRATERIREDTPAYVDRCRRMFLETFYYKTNGYRLARILGSVCSSGAPL